MGEGPSLWRHWDFLKLWSGQTISVFGSQFSALALPVIAALVLNATPAQFGILAAAETAPFLLFGLVVGVWVDRHRRRNTMIFADLGRGTILATVAAAYIFRFLSLEFLYLSGFLVGVLTVFFDVAYQSYLPALVDRSQLVDANGKLEASRAASQVAGPGLAGVMIQVVSYFWAIALDALSYFVSAISLRWIRKPEPKPEGPTRAPMIAEVREGLAVVFGDRRLRSIAGCTATANFFGAALGAIYVPFALRELQLRPVDLGLIFGIGSLGSLAGALVSGRVAKRIGVGRAIVGGAVLFSVAVLPVAFATQQLAYPILISSQLAAGVGALLYNINQVSLRQAITAQHLQGRMNATMRFLVWGTLPLGGLAGGILGQALSLRTGIAVAVAGGMVAFLFVYFSPVRSLERIPEAPVQPLPPTPGGYAPEATPTVAIPSSIPAAPSDPKE